MYFLQSDGWAVRRGADARAGHATTAAEQHAKFPAQRRRAEEEKEQACRARRRQRSAQRDQSQLHILTTPVPVLKSRQTYCERRYFFNFLFGESNNK